MPLLLAMALALISNLSTQKELFNALLLQVSSRIMTIPCLELSAAVVAVKLSCKLNEELNIGIDSGHFWTDSKIVLSYLNNDVRRFMSLWKIEYSLSTHTLKLLSGSM